MRARVRLYVLVWYLGTQFFCPFRPARGGRWWLRGRRPARDQYESSCSSSSYPAGLVIFGFRLTGTAFVFLLSISCRGIRCTIVFTWRRLCKRTTKLTLNRNNYAMMMVGFLVLNFQNFNFYIFHINHVFRDFGFVIIKILSDWCEMGS